MSTLADASAQFGIAVFHGTPRSNDGSNHVDDIHYKTLRSQAQKAFEQHQHFATEASHAYQRADHALASKYSDKSKKLLLEADRLNDEAAAWIFNANNTDSAKDEIDLHGLFVKEAVVALDARIKICQNLGQPVLKAIVGKGLHSKSHISKLRPAILSHCGERGIASHVDPHNEGVVIIYVYNSQPENSQPGYTQQSHPQHDHRPQQMPSMKQGLSILRQILNLVRQCF